ncbi:hypothetical protein [Paenibacillus terrigena]|nr:hypothetical protein [Paenibacillus terrigena]
MERLRHQTEEIAAAKAHRFQTVVHRLVDGRSTSSEKTHSDLL